MNAVDFTGMVMHGDGVERVEVHDLFTQLGVKEAGLERAVAWHMGRRLEELADYGLVVLDWNAIKQRTEYFVTQVQGILLAGWINTPRCVAVRRVIADACKGRGLVALLTAAKEGA